MGDWRMDWRILLSTFVLILLAELGDKTQLAALASSASSKSTWSVFAGACLALLLSTLVAVLVGAAFKTYLPARAIHAAAGVAFVVMGILWITRAIAGPVESSASAAAGGPSIVTRLAMEAAAKFEAASSTNYLDLATATDNPKLRDLFTELAFEDRCHLARVRSLKESHGETTLAIAAATPVAPPPAAPDSLTEIDRTTIASAAAHEDATAQFYFGLAEATASRSLRAAFLRLGEEDRAHGQRLRAWIGASG